MNIVGDLISDADLIYTINMDVRFFLSFFEKIKHVFECFRRNAS